MVRDSSRKCPEITPGSALFKVRRLTVIEHVCTPWCFSNQTLWLRDGSRIVDSPSIDRRTTPGAGTSAITTEMTVVGKVNHGCRVSRATTQNRCAQTR